METPLDHVSLAPSGTNNEQGRGKKKKAMDLKADHLTDFPKDISSQVPEVDSKPCQSYFNQETATLLQGNHIGHFKIWELKKTKVAVLLFTDEFRISWRETLLVMNKQSII